MKLSQIGFGSVLALALMMTGPADAAWGDFGGSDLDKKSDTQVEVREEREKKIPAAMRRGTTLDRVLPSNWDEMTAEKRQAYILANFDAENMMDRPGDRLGRMEDCAEGISN